MIILFIIWGRCVVLIHLKIVNSNPARGVVHSIQHYVIRKVWRYQRGNQYIEDEQTTQWPTEKEQKVQTTIYKTFIKCVIDLRQVGGFLWLPPSIKLNASI